MSPARRSQSTRLLGATALESRPARRGPYSKSAGRQQDILDAALAVFGRSGYRSGSIREIADAVGMSQAGLLHHFENKSALLIAVLRRRDETSLSRFPGPRGVETLLTLLDVVAFNVEHRGTTELHCVLSAEATAPDHPAHQYFVDRYEYVRGLLTDAFERAAERGQLRAGIEPSAASRSTLALMDGLQVQWLLAPDSVDMVADMRSYLQQLVTKQAWRTAEAARRQLQSTSVDAK